MPHGDVFARKQNRGGQVSAAELLEEILVCGAPFGGGLAAVIVDGECAENVGPTGTDSYDDGVEVGAADFDADAGADGPEFAKVTHWLDPPPLYGRVSACARFPIELGRSLTVCGGCNATRVRWQERRSPIENRAQDKILPYTD